MSLFRDPTSAEDAAPDAASEAPQPEVAVERPCPSCGAALAPDQDWCLECGAAAGDRSGGLPGWRTAAATIAACLVLASGAVAAAYAALSASEDDAPPVTASATPPAAPDDLGAAPPIGTTDPGVAPPVTPPSEEIPLPVEPPPPADVPAPVAPPPSVAPIAPPPPVTPPAAAPPPTTEPGGKDKGGPDDEGALPEREKAPLVLVELEPDAGATYDPSVRPADPAPDPALALDGDPATSWSVPLVTEAQIDTPAAGLLVTLDKPIGLRRLRITPTTPGTTIEIYGATSKTPPPEITDDGWRKLATRLDVEGRTSIPLGDGDDKVRHLLVWFSVGPVDRSPSVGVSELKLWR